MRDDGSQVKRYGRAGGPSGIVELSGLVGLEGRDEASDISFSQLELVGVADSSAHIARSNAWPNNFLYVLIH